MAARIKLNIRSTVSPCLLFVLLFFSDRQITRAQEFQNLTRDEFNTQLRQAFIKGDEQQAFIIVRDNRLFVKPFVDGMIRESLTRELKGQVKESEQAKLIAYKTAASFEKTFGERSLTIAVNYLTTWTKEQKGTKLDADSLYALGINLRGSENEKALEYHQKALDLYKSIGDERGKSEVLGGLGLIYTYFQGL